MEVMIETCCGIDVHQKSIVCCILDGPLESNKPKKIQKNVFNGIIEEDEFEHIYLFDFKNFSSGYNGNFIVSPTIDGTESEEVPDLSNDENSKKPKSKIKFSHIINLLFLKCLIQSILHCVHTCFTGFVCNHRLFNDFH